MPLPRCVYNRVCIHTHVNPTYVAKPNIVHTHICTYQYHNILTYVCLVYVRMCVRMSVHTYTKHNLTSYIHTYICTYIHTYVHIMGCGIRGTHVAGEWRGENASLSLSAEKQNTWSREASGCRPFCVWLCNRSPCMAYFRWLVRVTMPQKASSSLRYMSSTATRLLIPWQYPRVCSDRGRGWRGRGGREKTEGRYNRQERRGKRGRGLAIECSSSPQLDPAPPHPAPPPNPAHFHCSGHSPGCTQSRQPRHGTAAVVCKERTASVNTGHGWLRNEH